MQPKFSSPIIVNPYKSARADFIPKPGLLTVDSAGLLTVTDDEGKHIVLQKPLNELKSIESFVVRKRLGMSGVPAGTVYIYAGLNEAYQITFGSGDAALDGGIKIYQDFLQGGLDKAIQDFPSNDPTKFTAAQKSEAADVAYKNYTDFITIAKGAGIYKPVRKTFPFLSIIFLLIVFALAVWLSN